MLHRHGVNARGGRARRTYDPAGRLIAVRRRTLYLPPSWWLIVTVLAPVEEVAAFTVIPAWLSTVI
jgi:hypothetical protein